jgi:hypothetical protein
MHDDDKNPSEVLFHEFNRKVHKARTKRERNHWLRMTLDAWDSWQEDLRIGERLSADAQRPGSSAGATAAAPSAT